MEGFDGLDQTYDDTKTLKVLSLRESEWSFVTEGPRQNVPNRQGPSGSGTRRWVSSK